MGYYTDFEVTAERVGNRRLNEEELEKEFKRLYLDGNFKDGWYASLKWYDHDSDMRALSWKYKDVLFTVRGHGEESEDMWVEYYLNGGMQSCPARIIYDDLDMNLLRYDAQLWEATKWNGTSTPTT